MWSCRELPALRADALLDWCEVHHRHTSLIVGLSVICMQKPSVFNVTTLAETTRQLRSQEIETNRLRLSCQRP